MQSVCFPHWEAVGITLTIWWVFIIRWLMSISTVCLPFLLRPEHWLFFKEVSSACFQTELLNPGSSSESPRRFL